MTMDVYIKRRDVLSLAKKGYLVGNGNYQSVKNYINSIPAADVRPVVLCRDCKWCHAGYCEKYDDLIPFGCANKPWEDWFCADGKKREES